MYLNNKKIEFEKQQKSRVPRLSLSIDIQGYYHKFSIKNLGSHPLFDIDIDDQCVFSYIEPGQIRETLITADVHHANDGIVLLSQEAFAIERGIRPTNVIMYVYDDLNNHWACTFTLINANSKPIYYLHSERIE